MGRGRSRSRGRHVGRQGQAGPPDHIDTSLTASDLSITYEESIQWSGPLPPSSELRAYNEVVENGAERMFAQFEAEAANRRGLENKAMAERTRDRKAAQRSALVFAISALLVGTYCVYMGATTVAGVVLGTTLVGVIGAFLLGEKKQ